MTDWPATLASSGIAGAAAGGLISWLAAPHLANREERGHARSEARQQIRSIAGRVWANVRQYQDRALGSMGRELDDPSYMDDVVLCAQIRTASTRLGCCHRHAVARRLKLLFGPATLELCDVYGDAAGQPDKVVGILLMRDINAIKNPERFRRVDRGQFDQALRCPPDSKEIVDLVQSLRRLKESW